MRTLPERAHGVIVVAFVSVTLVPSCSDSGSREGATRRMSQAIDEDGLAQVLGDTATPDAEVEQRLRDLPAGVRFSRVARWLELARDERVPAWRRLAAIDLVLDHCLTYPIERSRFVRETLE